MPGMNDRWRSAMAGFPLFEPGHVWLAGSGPGDPGMLTLHALAGLAEADVVVHDALVDPRVLALAHPGAILEFAGKRGGKPAPSQANITDRLIALARAGNRVLRLKGGDPCVFGRGGEEALALASAGVPFRIIPGVTSGLAALTVASIPATLRGEPGLSGPAIAAMRKTPSTGRRSLKPGSRSCSIWVCAISTASQRRS
jgi:uroporphyrin-III C-methyltransferase